VRQNGFALDGIQSLPHGGRRVFAMTEETDKSGDCALKVDIVFPEGIVGVNEQRLAGREAGHELRIQAGDLPNPDFGS
jgi:hypothetical protein